jgi:peptide/nickel transport system substrate-binding protein
MSAVAMSAPASAQKSGGTLRMYNSTNPPSASLHEETTIASVMSFAAVYNNLVRFDPMQAKNSPDNIQPELATSWQWDDSRTRLTFKLRADVKWHDGQPFTSRDVQCTWHRLNGKEKDYLRRNPRLIWYENLLEVTTNGDHEATFVLSKPQASLLSMLAAGYSPVYPCHVSSRDMRVKPIGTGPFRFSEFKSNELIRLERNKDYWKKGFPYLDALEWRIVTNRSTRILAFIAGEFDMTQIVDVTVPLLKDIREKAPHAQCALVQANGTVQALINPERAPLDNPDIRMAMQLALDRQAFVDIMSHGQGSIGATMMAPPGGSWGMPMEELAKLPSYGDPRAQRADAIKIMEKHGYGPTNKLKLKVVTRDFTTFRDHAVLLVDQLNKINFAAELEVIESSLWYNKLFKKDYAVALNQQGYGIDDPDAVLRLNYKCESEANFTKYCNPDIERMLDEQSQEADPLKRKALVWEIERRLVNEVARPTLYQQKYATCWQPHVRDFVQPENSIYNNNRFEQVWLAR